MRALWITAGASFLVDQASKAGVLYGLDLLSLGRVAVAEPFLVFRMAWNRGINFGLFSGDAEVMRWALTALAVGISAAVAVWISRERPGRLAEMSGGLLIGGALGNAIDRAVYGAVADFINMSCCGIRNPFSFNVADVAIFAGAIGLILFTPQGKKGARDGAGKDG